MKKNFVLILFSIIGWLYGHAQVELSTAAYVHGYWTQWDQRNYTWYGLQRKQFDYNAFSVSNVFSGMEFRLKNAQPWDWCFMFEIYDYVKPDKKSRKEHQKNNIWYEYSGYVEYYVTDDYPTIEKVLEKYQFPMISPKGNTARALRRAEATIRIAPYKKEPNCFNIYFDGIGVGIYFSKLPFDKSYFIK